MSQESARDFLLACRRTDELDIPWAVHHALNCDLDIALDFVVPTPSKKKKR
jgi:hypothetical protein